MVSPLVTVRKAVSSSAAVRTTLRGLSSPGSTGSSSPQPAARATTAPVASARRAERKKKRPAPGMDSSNRAPAERASLKLESDSGAGQERLDLRTDESALADENGLNRAGAHVLDPLLPSGLHVHGIAGVEQVRLVADAKITLSLDHVQDVFVRGVGHRGDLELAGADLHEQGVDPTVAAALREHL